MERDRPSATAVLVVRGIAAVAAEPGLASLVPGEAARLAREILVRESASSRRVVALLGRAWFRRLVFAVADRVTPGILLHFALRKRFLEGRVRAALAEGFGRVVVLGAGLDTLAVRLAREFPDAEFVEVDHPASQRVKQRLLPEEPPPNLRFVAADFVAEGLGDLGEDLGGETTVFVAEGLLMYLPPAAVRALFGAMRGARCRVAFTAMTLGTDGRPGFRRSSGLVDRWLALRREPFAWGIRPEEVAAFLEELGFALVDRADAARLRAENVAVVGNRPLAEGEHVYVAERRDVGGS